MKRTILSLVVIGLILSWVPCSNGIALNKKGQVHWKKIPNVAQYKGADWANEIRREYGISVEKAKKIGASNSDITYFFHVKGEAMYLEGAPGPEGWAEKGIFHRGDAVFFSGKPWYGSAPGLADSYERQ